MARTWPRPDATARAQFTSVVAQAAWPGPRFERDVPEAVRSIGQTRAGAQRRWPGPGRVRTQRCPVGPPALWRKLPGQARSSSATCPRAFAPSARTQPALRDDGQDLAASGRNGARSVRQRCGASCLARPALRACPPRGNRRRTSSATCPRPSAPSARPEPALRDDGQGLAAVGRDGCRRGPPVLRRKRPGQARGSSATCPRPSAPSARPEPALRDDGQGLAAVGRDGCRRGPPVLRRKLPGQARTSSATCPRPSAPSARTEPALRDDGQGLAAVGRDGCRRGPPVLRRKRPGQARASSATCPRPSAPSARPEPALRDDGQDLAAPGRNGARSIHQRCGASCLARPAVRARRAPGRSLHRPGHSRR